MQTLEARGLLDRAVEFLPDDMELAERRRRGAAADAAGARGAARLRQAHAVRATCSNPSVPDDPYLGARTRPLFPEADCRERFPTRCEQHRLRREIIATQLANSMINRGGPSLVVRIADQTGAAPAAIAAAFAAVRDSYGMTGAQRRDRRARQQDRRASCSSSSMPRCRTCCSTGWSGSCAMSI